MTKRTLLWLSLAISILLTACTPSPTPTPTAVAQIELPTVAAVAATLTPEPTATTAPTLPATWTPQANVVETATPLGDFVVTPRATSTPWPTFTATPLPTNTPAPTATATQTAVPTDSPTASTNTSTAVPVATGDNLLINGSFESGWYHPNGEPELQIPDNWRFEFDEGDNSLDPDPWNKWVRPEVRVLSGDFLPPNEHDLFIWDGKQTVKIFKGSGSISYRLFNDVTLPPGQYRFTVQIFPDLVGEYDDYGTKSWAADPLSGEVKLYVGNYQTEWMLPRFGEKNSFSHTFTINENQTIRIGLGARGRWAIPNNGWFMDNWSITAVN